MRFGLNSFLYTSPFTTAQAPALLRKFARWGFACAEIAVEDPAHVDPRALRAAAAKAGIAIGAICAAMGPGRDFRGTAAEQRTAQRYLRALVDQAVAVGAPRITGPLYSVVGRIGAHDEATKARHFRLVVRNLKSLGAYARARGIELCVEPLNRFETDFLNTVDQGLRLVKAVGLPNVKLHLDTFHMNIEEKDQAAAIRKAGRHIGHFHACGTDRGIPGADSLDWKAIAAALKAVGYKGDVVIESFTPDVKVIARAAAIWRTIETRKDDIPTKGLANLRKAFGRR
jgi:D-psicose/D-tagatose/L-ribulose 3-epimerase